MWVKFDVMYNLAATQPIVEVIAPTEDFKLLYKKRHGAYYVILPDRCFEVSEETYEYLEGILRGLADKSCENTVRMIRAED